LLPCAAIRFIPTDLRGEAGCQRNPSPMLALSSSEHRHKEAFARVRPLRCSTQPK
jgi:hypothetical protein